MTYVNEGSVMGVGILFVILGTTAVATRIFVRHKTSSLAWDDWFCLIAWVLVMGECGIMIAGSATHTVGAHSPPGLGMNILYYEGWDQMLLERFEYPFDAIQVVALSCLKLSVLLFYRRIFVGRIFEITSAILISIVAIWGVTFFVLLFAHCGTHFLAQFQSLEALRTQCLDTFAIFIGLAASDVVVDLIILAIPIPMILSLHMPLKKRIGILAVFLVGMIATSCGIARMSLFIEILGPKLFSKSTVGGVPSDDDIGIVSILMYWGFLEMGVATIGICLPIMYRLLRDFFSWNILESLKSLKSSSTRRTFGGRNNSHDHSEPESSEMTRFAHEPLPGEEECSANSRYEVHVKAKSDRSSGKNAPQHREVWEHARITQASEMV